MPDPLTIGNSPSSMTHSPSPSLFPFAVFLFTHSLVPYPVALKIIQCHCMEGVLPAEVAACPAVLHWRAAAASGTNAEFIERIPLIPMHFGAQRSNLPYLCQGIFGTACNQPIRSSNLEITPGSGEKNTGIQHSWWLLSKSDSLPNLRRYNPAQ